MTAGVESHVYKLDGMYLLVYLYRRELSSKQYTYVNIYARIHMDFDIEKLAAATRTIRHMIRIFIDADVLYVGNSMEF